MFSRFIKKCLLATVIGSVTVVLAGCYGAPVRPHEKGPQQEKQKCEPADKVQSEEHVEISNH